MNEKEIQIVMDALSGHPVTTTSEFANRVKQILRNYEESPEYLYLVCILDDEHYTDADYEIYDSMDKAKSACMDREIYEFYPVDGVTTNPSILAKSGRSPYEVLKEIRQFIGQDAELRAQVIARDAEGMIKDGHRIVEELGSNTFVKVPSVREGFKAMKALTAEGIAVTATAIYTPMQGYLAGKCGASYAAPYINRIDNMGYNGIQVAKEIHDIYKNNNMKTEVLAASFKNSQQVLELCKYGIGAATIAPDVIEGLVKNQAITSAIDAFVADFESLAGDGKTMSDC